MSHPPPSSSTYGRRRRRWITGQGYGVLAPSTSVFCYARIMVDMVDAVGDFKMFSEFMSPGGKFKPIFVLAVPLNACDLGSMARLLRSPSLASLFYSSSFFAHFCRPAMIVLKKPRQPRHSCLMQTEYSSFVDEPVSWLRLSIRCKQPRSGGCERFFEDEE